MELVLISLYTYEIKPITNNGGVIKNTLAQYFEFVERTSKRKTAEKKKRKNIAQRKNNLPLGFFWNIKIPHMPKATNNMSSIPANIIVIGRLNHKKFPIVKNKVNTPTMLNAKGIIILSSIFL